MSKMIRKKTKTIEEYYDNDPLMQLLKPLLIEKGTWQETLQRDFKIRTKEKERSRYYPKNKL